MLGEVERDLRAGVAHADDERTPPGEIGAAAIVAAVHDAAGEDVVALDRRHVRDVVRAGRDDDDARPERAAVDGRRQPAAAFDRHDRLRLGAEAWRDAGTRGVVLEVVDDALARHVLRQVGREVEAGQGGQRLHRVKVQPLVVRAPGRADPIGLVDDLDLVTGVAQRLCRREPGGAGADDEDLDVHAVSVSRRARIPTGPVAPREGTAVRNRAEARRLPARMPEGHFYNRPDRAPRTATTPTTEIS